MLKHEFKIEVDYLPDHWIPLTIVGTLDWVVICGWWIFRNTGIFQSDDPYQWIFDFDGYEFDPDKLLVFRNDAERNKLLARLRDPDLEGKERTEALPFLFHDVFEVWWRHEHEMTPEEAERFFPPGEFIEATIFATFMWILDEYGKKWIHRQDEVFSCVFDFGVAYLSKWDNTLLDPKIMVETKRPQNSCKYCGEVLWCVGGTTIGEHWYNVCNHCLVNLAMTGHEGGLDEFEVRLREPSCPHWKGVDNEAGTCISTCPHSGMTQDKVWEKMEEWGAGRQEAYREHVRGLGGKSPRQVAGQTIDDIVGHFKRARRGDQSFGQSPRKLGRSRDDED
jgi:hypothetical protein